MELTRPEGVSIAAMERYIKEAISHWSKGGPPDDPMWNVGKNLISIKHINKDNIRYVAFHVSDPGFETYQEVVDWISNNENPENYFVVATTADFVPNRKAEEYKAIEEQRRISNAYDRGVKAERDRLKKVLGIF